MRALVPLSVAAATLLVAAGWLYWRHGPHVPRSGPTSARAQPWPAAAELAATAESTTFGDSVLFKPSEVGTGLDPYLAPLLLFEAPAPSSALARPRESVPVVDVHDGNDLDSRAVRTVNRRSSGSFPNTAHSAFASRRPPTGFPGSGSLATPRTQDASSTSRPRSRQRRGTSSVHRSSIASSPQNVARWTRPT